MKRQLYFPPRRAEQNLWLENFRRLLPSFSLELGLRQEEVDEALADIEWLLHVRRDLRNALDHAAKSATALERVLGDGAGRNPVLPLEVVLPPPPSIPPVMPGALRRLFRLVRLMKNKQTYTPAIGRQLGLEDNHYVNESAVPTFSLRADHGAKGEPVVVIKFSRHGYLGVYAEARLWDGEWEPVMRGPLTGSVFHDTRPLLDPARPEIREYRLRFWKGSSPVGDWTDPRRITVSP